MKYKRSFTLLRMTLSYFYPFKSRVALSLFSTIIVALCTTALAWVMKPALDDIFINKQKNALIIIPFVAILIVTFNGIFSFFQKYNMSYCGLKVLQRIQEDLHAKIIRLPMEFYNDSQVGVLMSRIINDVILISKSLPAIVRFISEFLKVFGLIFYILYLDYKLAFWSLLVLPLTLYPIIYFGKKLRKFGRRGQQKIADVSSLLQETLNGIHVLKAFSTEEKEEKRFKEQNGKFVSINIRGKIYNQLSSPIMDLIGAFAGALIIWIGGLQVIDGKMTAGEFFSFLTAIFLLYEPFKNISSSNMDIQNALAGAERVFDILHNDMIRVEVSGDTDFVSPFNNLFFKDVEFTYPGCTVPALKKINLVLNAGERVALIGPSGSGKTTLAQLIPRFHDCTSGVILMNSLPLQKYTLSSLRRSIGIVSQDPFLFNMTVRENIAYGQEDVSFADVEAASKAAYAHDFILELQDGYDTLIGEKGVKISGGQKQRLTIARALLKNPPLLILDEATSALDTQAEQIVQKALENLMRNRTSLIIAHRLSTILSADRIVVMSKGEIQDIGSHQDLLARNALYAKLYAMQFRDLPPEEQPESCSFLQQAK